MSTSSEFDDAVAARRDRRSSDEALLGKWIDGNKPLAGLLANLDSLKGKGFEFEVTSGFRPAPDEDTASEYIAPSLTKVIDLKAGETVKSATITVDVDGNFTFVAEGAETKSGKSKAALYKALDAWVNALHAAHPDLNIAGHLLRAQTQVGKRKGDEPKKAA
ncbi:MAG: hypothetical protein EBQ96_04595 [Proteobacteria bacterium]|nr:hypothetical protein [Pseudomonadota bacterium]